MSMTLSDFFFFSKRNNSKCNDFVKKAKVKLENGVWSCPFYITLCLALMLIVP